MQPEFEPSIDAQPGTPGTEVPDTEGIGEAETADEREPVDWNPVGLDLARAVASGIALAGNGRPVSPRSKRRRAAESRTRPTAAGPDDRDPQTFDDALDRLVADRGWQTDVAVAGALARWPQIVGPQVAEHCRAERVADGVLTVRTDSTAWATQVRMLVPTLLRRLADELGPSAVHRVEVHGPAVADWRRGTRSVRGARGPRDTYG